VLGGERQPRQREQRLCSSELPNRAGSAPAPVRDGDTPAVEIGLRLRRRRDWCRAPPRLCHVVDRLLDDTLALRPVCRTDRDGDAVVLRGRGGLRAQPVAARVDDRSHPIGPPRLRCPAEPAQDTVEGFDQVRERHPVSEHAADPAGVRQRADQHVGLLAPRRLRQLEPVKLQLLTRLMIEPDGDLDATGLAAIADRSHAELADLADQRRVGAIEPERDELAEQHAGAHVRVIDEPRLEVGAVGLQAARLRLPGGSVAGQVLRDRLAVPAGVPGDRGLRPTSARERVYLHVVLLGQHPHGPPHPSWPREPLTVRGTPDGTAHARGDRLRLGPTGLTSVEPRARRSLRATALGNSGDQPWGENRDRGHQFACHRDVFSVDRRRRYPRHRWRGHLVPGHPDARRWRC